MPHLAPLSWVIMAPLIMLLLLFMLAPLSYYGPPLFPPTLHLHPPQTRLPWKP